MKKIIISNIAIFIVIFLANNITYAFADMDLKVCFAPFKVKIDSEEKIFEKPLVTINDSTYVPLREMCEKMNLYVEWTNEDKSINIKEMDTLYMYEENGLWGYKNTEGEIVIKAQYTYADEFSEGLAMVGKGKGPSMEAGYINQNGDVVIACQYYEAFSFSDGVAAVSLATHTDELKYTYIDKNGNRLFEKEFQSSNSFSEDYAVVLKEGYLFPVPPELEIPKKWTYIDKTGECATDMVFDEAYAFENGYAKVKHNGKLGIIDKNFNLYLLQDKGQ